MESLNDTVSSHMTSRDRSPMEVSCGQFSSTEEDSGDDVSTTVGRRHGRTYGRAQWRQTRGNRDVGNSHLEMNTTLLYLYR